MKIACIGGGPAGLYLGVLMKLASPRHQITVIERNRPDDTFGFGVVFSDATLGNLEAADPVSYGEIARHFARWDDLEIHVGGAVVRSHGHGFCGLERKRLLEILQRRAHELGVVVRFEETVTDLARLADADLIVGCDGVASWVREQHADRFGPHLDIRPNKFVWLGTSVPFDAFTFYFKDSPDGLFRVHAYPYARPGEGGTPGSTFPGSTFIVECTEATWRRAGFADADEDQTIAYLERVFAAELSGHRLVKNRSIWRSFPTVRNQSWRHDNVVLVGDAAHTAHFSIGSGTKLAMEDCIALRDALVREPDVAAALSAYELGRRPVVEELQHAAQVSLEWFEHTERYRSFEPVQFVYSLLTRSLRVKHASLKKRDPALVEQLERWFAAQVSGAGGGEAGEPVAPPLPMFVPLQLRGLRLANRIALAPWPLAAASDGVVGDAHLVFLGARAAGGVGLIFTEPCTVLPGAVGLGAALASDDHAVAWARIVDYVHGAGAAAIAAVLGVGEGSGDVDVARLRSLVVEAAQRARFAGFDLLALDVGGILAAPELVATLVAALREAWPAERPLAVRVAGGASQAGHDDACALAAAARHAGADLIAVAATPFVRRPDEIVDLAAAQPRTPLADRIRNELGVPTVLEEGAGGPTDWNQVLAAGRADLCALGAALALDPSFVNRSR